MTATIPPRRTDRPLDADARSALGRTARRGAPRASHAEWRPGAQRRDPREVLEQESATRIPELVPIRYGRMLASAFTFFRGAAGIMAADLAGTPTSGLDVQLCGDAHLSNFGIFAAPDRRLVFDLDDFDETHQGPWEWDVKRLAASVEVAGRDARMSAPERRAAVLATVGRYREAMREFALMTNLEVWYARMNVDDAGLELVVAASKARTKDSARAVARLTETVDGQLRFVHDPPLVERVDELMPEREADELEEQIQRILRAYAESLPPDRRRLFAGYRYVDLARKVVGVGSVGTRSWILLLQGRDEADALVLQAKEAERSVLEEYLEPSRFANRGERVVQGQLLMQAASDIFLGWLHVTGFDGRPRDFYVRQLWDGKGSADVSSMSPKRLARYGQLCGWALARAHARSGDRVAIAGYLGSGAKFDEAVATFAAAYADQNDADFAALRAAVDDGTLAAQEL